MDHNEELQQSRLFDFQTLLDGSRYATQHVIDKGQFRELCRNGIPSHPLHLRPLSYSLLLGILPLDKRAWRTATRNHRVHYYTLIKTHMEALEAQSPPADSLIPGDKILVSIAQDVTSAASRYPFLKDKTRLTTSSPLAPPRPLDLDPANAEDDDEEGYLDVYTSSSSEEEDSELVARSKEAHPNSPRAVKRLLCRRDAFKRLEAIATATHRNRYPKRQDSGSSSKAASGSQPNSPQASLSPRITLSTESTPQIGFSHYVAPAMETPQLSLSFPQNRDDSVDYKAPSPITLLPSKPIPAPGSSTQGTFVSGSLLQPDTHAEAVIRLLYVFSQSNTQWTYHQGLVDLIVTLYFVYLEMDYRSVSRKRKGKPTTTTRQAVATSKWAEEQTYWAFCALVREFETVIQGPSPHSHPKSDTTHCLEGLGTRLKWTDEPLWSILRENDLDPSSPVFASRWITVLLGRDLPFPYLLPAWDYILSSETTSEKALGRLDALIDLTTALLVVSRKVLLGINVRVAPTTPARRSGLWGDDEAAETLNSSFDQGRLLELLRSLPITKICEPQYLLEIANEIRLARLKDHTLNLDFEPQSSSQWSSLESGAKILQQYADVEKISTWSQSSANWASSTMAKVAGQISTTSVETATQASSNLWSSLRKWAPTGVSQRNGTDFVPESQRPEPEDHHRTPPPRNAPRPLALARQRSDSAASGFSVSSLQEQLAGVTSAFTSPDTPASRRSSLQSVGVKPLLLSGAARRASNSSSKLRRESNPLTSPARLASPPSGALSPPAVIDSERGDEAVTPTGLYRIGSRQDQNSMRREGSRGSVILSLDHGQ